MSDYENLIDSLGYNKVKIYTHNRNARRFDSDCPPTPLEITSLREYKETLQEEERRTRFDSDLDFFQSLEGNDDLLDKVVDVHSDVLENDRNENFHWHYSEKHKVRRQLLMEFVIVVATSIVLVPLMLLALNSIANKHEYVNDSIKVEVVHSGWILEPSAY